MLLLGSKPPGRHTEQHDIFFGIAQTLKDLVPAIYNFWPEAEGNLHVDAWREVTTVDGHLIEVVDKTDGSKENTSPQLFFINLGGYRQNLFDEPHFKILTVRADKGAAIQYSKTTEFYKKINFPGAQSHIDDKYGVDVDDLYEIEEILPADQKENYCIKILPGAALADDELHLGYFKMNTLP